MSTLIIAKSAPSTLWECILYFHSYRFWKKLKMGEIQRSCLEVKVMKNGILQEFFFGKIAKYNWIFLIVIRLSSFNKSKKIIAFCMT